MNENITDRELLIRIDERVRNLEREFRDFKTLMSESYVKQKEFARVQADVAWVKKFFWVVATAGIGGLITGVMALLLK